VVADDAGSSGADFVLAGWAFATLLARKPLTVGAMRVRTVFVVIASATAPVVEPVQRVLAGHLYAPAVLVLVPSAIAVVGWESGRAVDGVIVRRAVGVVCGLTLGAAIVAADFAGHPPAITGALGGLLAGTYGVVLLTYISGNMAALGRLAGELGASRTVSQIPTVVVGIGVVGCLIAGVWHGWLGVRPTATGRSRSRRDRRAPR
jgi:hypothetical protein